MKKIRVGVIGVGYLGKYHAEKYSRMKNVDLTGVVDIDGSRAEVELAHVEGAQGIRERGRCLRFRQGSAPPVCPAVAAVVPRPGCTAPCKSAAASGPGV